MVRKQWLQPTALQFTMRACSSTPEGAYSTGQIEFERSVGRYHELDLTRDCREQLDASQILPDDVPAYTEMEVSRNYRFRVHQDEYPDVERVRDIRCESDEHSYRKRMEKSDDGQWVCPECGAAVSIRS